jgi:hypothetical protein
MHRALAAGVLPLAKDSLGGYWVLLGRECVGRTVSQSGLWCDFGGGISPHDCSTYGAAREFVEETLGCVLGHVSIAKTVTYILQHRLAIIQSMFGNAKPYDMHIVLCEYDTTISTLFDTRFTECTQADTSVVVHPTRLMNPVFLPARAFNRNGQIKQTFKEKDMISWFRLDELEDSVFHTDKIGLRPEFAQTLHHYWGTLQSALKC